MRSTITACVVILAGGAMGCVPDEPIDALEAALGGPEGVMDMFEQNGEGAIRDKLADYGIEYRVSAVITDCPKYFPSGDRNIWHNFNGEFYFVEGCGRPHRAYSYLPPIASEPRSDSCQLNVGQWGDAENPSNDYDGGHLIGSQLGGWGKRANLVPQDANFNRGNWVVAGEQDGRAVAPCRPDVCATTSAPTTPTAARSSPTT